MNTLNLDSSSKHSSNTQEKALDGSIEIGNMKLQKDVYSPIPHPYPQTPLCSGAFTPSQTDLVIYYLFRVLDPALVQSRVLVEECLPLKMLSREVRHPSASNIKTERISSHNSVADDLPDPDLDLSEEYEFTPTWHADRNLFCALRLSPLHRHDSHDMYHKNHHHLSITDVHVQHVIPVQSNFYTHSIQGVSINNENIHVFPGKTNATTHEVPYIEFCWNTTVQQSIVDNKHKEHYFALTYIVNNATSISEDDSTSSRSIKLNAPIQVEEIHNQKEKQSREHNGKDLNANDGSSFEDTTHRTTSHDPDLPITSSEAIEDEGDNDGFTRMVYLDTRGWVNPPTLLKWRFYALNGCDFEGYDESEVIDWPTDGTSHKHVGASQKKVGLTHGFDNAGFIEWVNENYNQSNLETYQIMWSHGQACQFSSWYYLLTVVLVFLVMSIISGLLCMLLSIAQNMYRNKDSRELKYYQLDSHMRKPAVASVKEPELVVFDRA